jgi:hypothetical protein
MTMNVWATRDAAYGGITYWAAEPEQTAALAVARCHEEGAGA